MSSYSGFGRMMRPFAVAMLALGLVACSGDDGDTGAQGPQGPAPIQGERTVAPDEVHPTITDVSISSPVVVDFWITDERGFAVTGVEEGPQFTVNKLVPGSDGETNVWSTYILSDDQGETDVQAGTYSDGTLEGHGDGTYTFTFADDLEDISGVAFEPSLTHRVGIELRDVMVLGKEIPAGSNAVHDFRPDGGSVAQREIVETESCQTCHGPEAFSFHGGPRKDVEYCVTCHQKGSIDVGTTDSPNNAMDFRVMIHKIHTGEDLHTVLGDDGDLGTADDGVYEFCGFGCENFGSDPDDFSHVAHPQDTRNCTTCHDPDDSDTPQASNVFDKPTAAVCASCHDDLAFDDDGLTNANGNHEVAKAQPNSNCVNCHTSGGLSVENAHVIPGQLAASRFEYNILEINSAEVDDEGHVAPGNSPTVKFSITDPTNGDAAYDVLNDPQFDPNNGASVNMDIAWPTSDYTNFDANAGSVTGTPPSRPKSIDLLQGGTVIVDNGDGTFTMDASQLDGGVGFSIPASQTGSGAVAIEGHPVTDIEGSFVQAPVTGAVDYFAITDTSPQARRTVVDSAKCQDCHGENDGLAFHGNNRTDNTQLCVVCHNPNQTDLFMRPADTDGTDFDSDGTIQADELFDGVNTAAADNLEDRLIDFKYMIHAIHGSGERDNDYTAYGFGVVPHTYSDVGLPRPVNDCLACHEEGTYELPLGSGVLASTLSSGATVTEQVAPFTFDDPGATAYAGAGGANDGSESDPGDDNNASATAAVCSSCHDSTDAANHMDDGGSGSTSFGNAILLANDSYPDGTDDLAHTQADMPAENCAFCHGPDGFVGVAEVHGVE